MRRRGVERRRGRIESTELNPFVRLRANETMLKIVRSPCVLLSESRRPLSSY